MNNHHHSAVSESQRIAEEKVKLLRYVVNRQVNSTKQKSCVTEQRQVSG